MLDQLKELEDTGDRQLRMAIRGSERWCYISPTEAQVITQVRTAFSSFVTQWNGTGYRILKAPVSAQTELKKYASEDLPSYPISL